MSDRLHFWAVLTKKVLVDRTRFILVLLQLKKKLHLTSRIIETEASTSKNSSFLMLGRDDKKQVEVSVPFCNAGWIWLVWNRLMHLFVRSLMWDPFRCERKLQCQLEKRDEIAVWDCNQNFGMLWCSVSHKQKLMSVSKLHGFWPTIKRPKGAIQITINRLKYTLLRRKHANGYMFCEMQFVVW